jgi:AP-1 complex subunit gamma-1
MDNFTSKAKSLLQINNHGVLLAGITLITEMCAADESICQTFRKVSFILHLVMTKLTYQATDLLVKHLKSLVQTGYSPEHDVGGLTDPFLQVKILRLLRILGKGDVTASETMNDILAQVSCRSSKSSRT